MCSEETSAIRIAFTTLFVAAFCCLPVWAFTYFVNQDGSAHLNSAFIMKSLLMGDQVLARDFSLNSLTVPNSTGHWLMALLLGIFSPFVVTKIIVTLTFVLPVAATVWLRFKTVGRENIGTILLFGTAISFNWLWLVGFYNFLIGFAVCGFTLGFVANWSDGLSYRRAALLSGLLIVAYFSHVVAFAVVAGASAGLLFFSSGRFFRRDFPIFIAALIPVAPLAFTYRAVNAGTGGGFFPVWRHLSDPFSPAAWFAQIRAADPFILISRKSLPFVDSASSLFAVFTPGVWIAVVILILITATLANNFRENLKSRQTLAFALLFSGTVAAAIFAPDDFGLTNGSVLRERLLLCGLLFAVPLFRIGASRPLRFAANALLIFVILFQAAALWEYAAASNREAREYFAVSGSIPAGASVASISRIENGLRFHSVPVPMMTSYLGMGPTRLVRDNYEIGHKLFPVRAADEEMQSFVFGFTRHSAFVLDEPTENSAAKFAELGKVLASHHSRIDYLILWNADDAVISLIAPYFETEPVFINGRLRLHRHK